MDRGAWQAIVHGVMKSQTQLGTHMEQCKKQMMIKFSEIVLFGIDSLWLVFLNNRMP